MTRNKEANKTHTQDKKGRGTLHNVALTQTFCSTLPLPPLPGLSLATAHLCCCCYDKMKQFEWSDARATQNKLVEQQQQPTDEATHTPPLGFPWLRCPSCCFSNAQWRNTNAGDYEEVDLHGWSYMAHVHKGKDQNLSHMCGLLWSWGVQWGVWLCFGITCLLLGPHNTDEENKQSNTQAFCCLLQVPGKMCGIVKQAYGTHYCNYLKRLTLATLLCSDNSINNLML